MMKLVISRHKDGFIQFLGAQKVEVAKKIKIFSDRVERSSGTSNVRLRRVSNVLVGCRTFG